MRERGDYYKEYAARRREIDRQRRSTPEGKAEQLRIRNERIEALKRATMTDEWDSGLRKKREAKAMEKLMDKARDFDWWVKQPLSTLYRLGKTNRMSQYEGNVSPVIEGYEQARLLMWAYKEKYGELNQAEHHYIRCLVSTNGELWVTSNPYEHLMERGFKNTRHTHYFGSEDY